MTLNTLSPFKRRTSTLKCPHMKQKFLCDNISWPFSMYLSTVIKIWHSQIPFHHHLHYILTRETNKVLAMYRQISALNMNSWCKKTRGRVWWLHLSWSFILSNSSIRQIPRSANTRAPPSRVHSLVTGSLCTAAVRPTAEAPFPVVYTARCAVFSTYLPEHLSLCVENKNF